MPIKALFTLLIALLAAGGLTAYGVSRNGGSSDVSKSEPAAPPRASADAGMPATARPGAPVPAESAADPTKPVTDTAAPAGAGQTQTVASATPQAGTVPDAGQTPAASAAPTPAQVQPSAVPKPSFDVVRVEPTGESVIAGKGVPGATVELLRNGQTFARAVADVGGQWAIVPPRLPPGAAELSLRVTTPDGRVALSSQVVSVEVPVHPGDPVLVVVNGPDTPTKVLSGISLPKVASAQEQAMQQAMPTAKPGDAGPAPVAGARSNVRIVSVEADQSGRFFVSGAAQAGADIRIYLNEAPVAKVTADAVGAFGLTVERGVVPGSYRVRADDVDSKTGRVLTRAEVSFTMQGAGTAGSPRAVVAGSARSPGSAGSTNPAALAAGSATLPSAGEGATPPAAGAAPSGSVAVLADIKTVTISQGDNLWRLSRKIYGRGMRYTVIYGANTTQIRNPGLIYPGQILVVPPSQKS